MINSGSMHNVIVFMLCSKQRPNLWKRFDVLRIELDDQFQFKRQYDRVYVVLETETKTLEMV
jgi:hypothetical protein